MEEQQVNQMPRIGDMAPDFEANTTYGPLKFSEYNKGSWVILFSHPADFTPVCTTEMSGFALRSDEFKALNTKLIGLSIDSIHAHVAWVNNVKKNTGVLFNFPIIADLDIVFHLNPHSGARTIASFHWPRNHSRLPRAKRRLHPTPWF